MGLASLSRRTRPFPRASFGHDAKTLTLPPSDQVFSLSVLVRLTQVLAGENTFSMNNDVSLSVVEWLCFGCRIFQVVLRHALICRGLAFIVPCVFARASSASPRRTSRPRTLRFRWHMCASCVMCTVSAALFPALSPFLAQTTSFSVSVS